MRLRSLAFPLALVVVIVGAFAVTYALGRPGSSDDPPPEQRSRAVPEWTPAPDEPQPAPAGPAEGGSAEAVFAHTCGSCHTLRAAQAKGLFGPDLDAARPSAAKVRRTIRTGSLDGVMQPRLLEGAQARRVAAYVARVAGRE
jgi:mono/diheme cytochrome c family protein